MPPPPPGKIVKDRGDGTYDIDYEDGEAEIKVSKDLIKVGDQPHDSRPTRHINT